MNLLDPNALCCSGIVLTLWEALKRIVPELCSLAMEIPGRERRFPFPLIRENELVDHINVQKEQLYFKSLNLSHRIPKPHFQNGIIRIQGIEPNPDLPMDWIAQNLRGPDHFLHACVLIIAACQGQEGE